MVVVGLTGSIAMGKSTLAALFRERGCPVFDADETVRECYRGECVAPIEAAFPGVAGAGGVDRERLAAYVVGNEAAIRTLEGIVHPAVALRRRRFLERARGAGFRVVILDIPLLFETAGDRLVDIVLVVSARPELQRARALCRGTWTNERFDALLARQLPDAEKRRRAHYVIDTSGTREDSQRQAVGFLRALGAEMGMRRFA